MDSNFNNENDPWEFSLDIDDSDIHLTPVLRPSSSTRVEQSPSTPNPVRIIPSPAVEDDDFKSGSWVSATNYANAIGGIFEHSTFQGPRESLGGVEGPEEYLRVVEGPRE
ncbi:hypothetical protein Tco_1160824 [Tanacetum coccineum]